MTAGHLEAVVRTAIVQACRRLAEEGLVIGTAGNISVRVDDGILITPSATPYETMRPEDVCAVDLHGDPRDARPGRPSSELDLHLAAYAASPSTNAVVHFHGRWVCAVAAALRDELPAVHYYAARLGAPVPIVPYAHFGSPELARSVGTALEGRKAALMANHGATTVGRSLDEAFDHARLLEWLCRLQVDATSLGGAIALSDGELGAVAATYARRNGEQGAP